MATKPSWLKNLEARDTTTGTTVSRAAAEKGYNGSGGGTGGSNNYNIGDYKITSDRGKNIAGNMKEGTSWLNDVDGSTWYKGYDGRVTVDHNGTRSPNAYVPSNYSNVLYQNEAQNWLQRQNISKPTAPKRDSRIDTLLNEILNREDFSYDAASDPLYQQYKEMYMREGDRAMRETMAEAVASAGGMNSYAMTAAQQANNYYNSQLNDKIPELYQLAYDMYLSDKESQIQNLGILQDMDDTQYARYRDTMNDYYNDKNFAYGMYQDAVDQGRWQTEYDYNAMINDRNFNYGVSQDALENDWREKEWNYNTDQKAKADALDEQDRAREEVEYLLGKGVPLSGINPETIQKADYNEEELKGIAASVVPTTSGGGGTRRYSYTPTGPEDGGDDGTSDYTLANSKSGDEWVYISGIGRVTWAEIPALESSGRIKEVIDRDNKTVRYVKA